MSKIAIITDIVGIIVSVFIIIFISDWDKNMTDSPNDHQVIDDIQSGKLIPDNPKDSEVIWSSNDNNQEVENTEEVKTCKDIYYCSESSDEEGHNDKSIWENSVKFSDSSDDSKSSDDGDYDDYWKHIRCKYEPKEEQKKVTESKQPTFYFDP